MAVVDNISFSLNTKRDSYLLSDKPNCIMQHVTLLHGEHDFTMLRKHHLFYRYVIIDHIIVDITFLALHTLCTVLKVNEMIVTYFVIPYFLTTLKMSFNF